MRLAAELRGDEVAQAIQLHMAYAPEPPFDSGAPEAAPSPILDSHVDGADHHGAARANGVVRRR